MKKLIYIVSLLFVGHLSYSQQIPLFSQYLNNKYMVNPAVAGSDGYTSFNLTTRNQWVGLVGAPKVNFLSFQTRFLKRGYVIKSRISGKKFISPQSDGKVGLGGYIHSYNSGLVQRTGFQFSYVYHTWVKNRTQLSIGMGISGYHFRIKEDQIIFEYQDDPILSNALSRGIFVPDASFGALILNRKYSIGFSADQLLGAAAKLGTHVENYRMSRHFYLMGTYSYFVDRKIELSPNVMIKMSEQLKPQANVGMKIYYDNLFWAGLTYRTGGALISNIGIQSSNYYIGYAFDYSLHEIQQITHGTHEVTLAVKFGDSSRRFRWVDRY